jgi:ABC-type Mn2+/Zn2+ transport system permease subunit
MKRLGVIVSISLLLSPAIAATESSRTWLHQFIAAKAPHPGAETSTASIMQASVGIPANVNTYSR